MGKMKDGVGDKETMCSTGSSSIRPLLLQLLTSAVYTMFVPNLAMQLPRMMSLLVLGTAAIIDFGSW